MSHPIGNGTVPISAKHFLFRDEETVDVFERKWYGCKSSTSSPGVQTVLILVIFLCLVGAVVFAKAAWFLVKCFGALCFFALVVMVFVKIENRMAPTLSVKPYENLSSQSYTEKADESLDQVIASQRSSSDDKN